jgi:hypothetical protein
MALSLPDSLISASGESDAVGVAARKGFRFQDVVAASLAVDMLANPLLEQIECETADDIVLRWSASSGVDIEYVQVKTTEDDSKWNITELTAQEKGKKFSSIAEKSLICDRFGGKPRFRIVSTRDVKSDLKPFCIEWQFRNPFDANLINIVDRISKKLKDSISPSGRNMNDWANALFWRVEPSIDSLKAETINKLLRLAQGQGLSPPWSVINDTYTRLLARMVDMADASKTQPTDKRWSRTDILAWWRSELSSMQAAAAGVVKVYRTPTLAFFSELHAKNDVSEKRVLHSYDVEYDGSTWRRSELIEYLLNWIPEISLPPSMLATFGHLNARRLTTEAIKALDQQGIKNDSDIVSNLMLHCILRHHFDSEPIACKLYYMVGGQMRTTNAHIIQSDCGDQLWLGRTRLVTATDYKSSIDAIVSELSDSLDPNILKEDRDIIVRLRDPRHLRSDSLNDVLSLNGKVADLLNVLRLPILLAYDSDILSKGYKDGYVKGLIEEVNKAYGDIKSKLSGPMKSVEIVIFLVPVECASTLSTEFGKKIRGSK